MSTKHAGPGTFDQKHRLFIPTGKVFNQAKYDALGKWITENPAPFAWLLENPDTLGDRRGYCSSSRIQSAFQDRYASVAKVDELKFNNSRTKYLKFRVVYLKPSLRHLFEFRRPPKHAPRSVVRSITVRWSVLNAWLRRNERHDMTNKKPPET